MAATKTTLASACTADDLLLRVTAAAGASVNCLVQVGDEFCVCTGIDGNNIKVRSRGSMGGRAKPHAVLAPVTFGLAVDFPADAPVQLPEWDVREASVNGDFDPGASGGKNLTRNTEIIIAKAGVYTQTITAPTQGQDGLNVRWVSSTANAHVITGVGLAGTGIGTFAATGGALGVRAQNGRWIIVESGGVTIT